MNRTRLALGPIRCGPPRAMLPSFFLLCPLVSARQSGHYETRCSDCGTIKKRQKDDGRNRVHPRGTQRLDAADSFSFRRAEREDATVPSYYFSRTRFYLFVYLFFPGVKTGPTADAAVRRLGSIFFLLLPVKTENHDKITRYPTDSFGNWIAVDSVFFPEQELTRANLVFKNHRPATAKTMEEGHFAMDAAVPCQILFEKKRRLQHCYFS